ncbi:hypothetical protein IC744_16340 [Microbacterium hominis]|uniref:hypothetical protein n=1 Tax=Microbacterium hominis TaxID=162426 RepID=UPI00168A7E30|nr:hypothetical protein [Microbacterium hominis]QOC24831.1 hypothetical protein IC745_10590 [Microbacterium hominis]QOC28884.1 hypothetical protein IC744_16340 [Microbacterium hominis]
MRELKLLTGHLVVIAADAVTLRGVIESASRSAVKLVNAEDVTAPQRALIAGAVLVPTARIQYVQVVEN